MKKAYEEYFKYKNGKVKIVIKRKGNKVPDTFTKPMAIFTGDNACVSDCSFTDTTKEDSSAITIKENSD